MNAYKLAENLDKFGSQDPHPLLFTKSATMLRQQADRIAELSKNVDELEEDLLKASQTKPLSDEQIFKLANMFELKANHALYAFARTLIREAQN